MYDALFIELVLQLGFIWNHNESIVTQKTVRMKAEIKLIKTKLGLLHLAEKIGTWGGNKNFIVWTYHFTLVKLTYMKKWNQEYTNDFFEPTAFFLVKIPFFYCYFL